MTAGAVASQGSGRDLFKIFRTPFPDMLSGDPADAPPIDPDSDGIAARFRWEVGRPGELMWGPPTITGVTGDAATDTFTKTAHGLVNGERVTLSGYTGGAGLTAGGTLNYVVNKTANTFQLSLSAGGAAVNFTTNVTALTLTRQLGDNSRLSSGGGWWGPNLQPRAPVWRAAGAPRQSVDSCREGVPGGADYRQIHIARAGIPIPHGAVPVLWRNSSTGESAGLSNDSIMAIWDPATDTLWEGAGMQTVLRDMAFYPGGGQTGMATASGLESGGNGTLKVGKVYFYRVTSVLEKGDGQRYETGIATPATAGNPTRVSRAIPTAANQRVQLRFWPRYGVDKVRLYRAEATNGPTFPSSPAVGANHRFNVTGPSGEAAGDVYKWNGTVWSRVFAETIPPVGDFGLIAELTSATDPALFEIDSTLYTWRDPGLAADFALGGPPVQSTAELGDDVWQAWGVSTLYNASACPGHFRDIPDGRPGSPQAWNWGHNGAHIFTSAGHITKRDFMRGEIDHIMICTLTSGSNTGYPVGGNSLDPPRGGWYDNTRHAYPAQSQDPGSEKFPTAAMLNDTKSPPAPGKPISANGHALVPGTTPGCPPEGLALPEGARMRLPADFDLGTIETSAAYKALPAAQQKLCRMVAGGLKHYGMVAIDGTGQGFAIHSSWPGDAEPDNPNYAPGGNPGRLYDGRFGTSWRPGIVAEAAALKPRSIGGPFPWDAIQIVRMGWGPDYRGDPADLTACVSGAPCPLGGQ